MGLSAIGLGHFIGASGQAAYSFVASVPFTVGGESGVPSNDEPIDCSGAGAPSVCANL